MFTEALVLAFFVIGIQLMVPIVMAALGEAVAEKSGVLNVGIEGMMLIGAFATAYMGITRRSAGLGILAAILAGCVFGALLAFLYVNRGTDQIVTGLMFNIFALGLTGTLHSLYLAGQNGETLTGIVIPGIGSIPWVGEILNKQSLMLYLAIALAFGVWYLLNKTWYGLYARAAGERPLAAGVGRAERPATPLSGRDRRVGISRARRLGPGPRYLGRLRAWHDCRSGIHRPGSGGTRQMAATLDHDLCPRVRFDPGSSIPGCSSTDVAIVTHAVLGGPSLSRHGDSCCLRSRLDLPGGSGDPVPPRRHLTPGISNSQTPRTSFV